MSKSLEELLLLVNKYDIWADQMSLDDILDDYRNELRRIKSQSERLGYTYMIRMGSALTGEGLDQALIDLFRRGIVSLDDVLAKAGNPDHMRSLLQAG